MATTVSAAPAKLALPFTAPRREALALLASGSMSEDEFDAWLEGHIALKEGTARQEGAKSNEKRLTIKTGRKGGLSVYGLQRMPVTLFPEQWGRLFAFREQVEAHIAANPVQEIAADDYGPAVKVRLKFKTMAEGSHIVK